MSGRNGTSSSTKTDAITPQKSKAMTAIDCVLEGKSDEFKLVVYELAAQINWDDNDPAFLIAIATGQLEVLIKQYPAQITQAMEVASKQLGRALATAARAATGDGARKCGDGWPG